MKKGIVHQVGYLQRLYRDARSTEHKITNIVIILQVLASRHGYIEILQKCVYHHTDVKCQFYVPTYYIMASYTHTHTHFFPFRLVTYCILAAQKIQYTLELLTEFFNCISYFNMEFKPFIVKNSVFLYLCICSQNFCNITIYPSFVMHLPEDGHKIGRNMYDEYCFCNIRYVHTFTCIFFGFVIITAFRIFRWKKNCSYYRIFR
jgi:hypothetical protein